MEIDRAALRSLIEDMEQAARSALEQDSAFFEALRALKWEIDSDSRVQSAIRELQANGSTVFNSFVPQVRIRIKTGEGVWGLPKRAVQTSVSANEQVRQLAQELKDAASAVIFHSCYRSELDVVVNEAVHADSHFERMAATVEDAGYELQICLDLSAYAQIREQSPPPAPSPKQQPASLLGSPGPELRLSERDFQFLKALRITTEQ